MSEQSMTPAEALDLLWRTLQRQPNVDNWPELLDARDTIHGEWQIGAAWEQGARRMESEVKAYMLLVTQLKQQMTEAQDKLADKTAAHQELLRQVVQCPVCYHYQDRQEDGAFVCPYCEMQAHEERLKGELVEAKRVLENAITMISGCGAEFGGTGMPLQQAADLIVSVFRQVQAERDKAIAEVIELRETLTWIGARYLSVQNLWEKVHATLTSTTLAADHMARDKAMREALHRFISESKNEQVRAKLEGCDDLGPRITLWRQLQAEGEKALAGKVD